MKTFLFTFLFLFISCLCHAQEFSFELYFEDAAGRIRLQQVQGMAFIDQGFVGHDLAAVGLAEQEHQADPLGLEHAELDLVAAHGDADRR